MKLQPTVKFDDDFKKLPEKIKTICKKQLVFLQRNLKHPSLRAKKIKGSYDIWEARITKKYRITFQIKDDIYILRRVGSHDNPLKRPV